MQLKKTYRNINPELLYDEIQDLVLKHGAILKEKKLETYALPGGSSHISRGTLIFKAAGEQSGGGGECIRVHVIGSAAGETKMILDIEESVFPLVKLSALEEELDFMFGPYEVGKQK